MTHSFSPFIAPKLYRGFTGGKGTPIFVSIQALCLSMAARTGAGGVAQSCSLDFKVFVSLEKPAYR